MTVTAEVIQFGHHFYSLCRPCEWRSAPQDSQSDALDRAVVHDHFNHGEYDEDPRLRLSGADEAVLRALEESW